MPKSFVAIFNASELFQNKNENMAWAKNAFLN